jgi:hypothetical protein
MRRSTVLSLLLQLGFPGMLEESINGVPVLFEVPCFLGLKDELFLPDLEKHVWI